ncbi:DUF4817 domain-containing protein [Trichonephila clavipes]|nr:DUF4817 domain-containing protein [Trichonephila clavipes]
MKLHFVCRQIGSRMEHYTKTELSDMHLAYGAADCNGRATQWLYGQRYPRRQATSHAFFQRLYHRLPDRRSFNDGTQEREQGLRTSNNEEPVLDLVQNTLSYFSHAETS